MSAAYKAASEAQRTAADPQQSVFVTANAGSGKTKVLVDRIARLLLAGAPPASFLCITFTKAAATEMQRRLIERLGAWCVADNEKLTQELGDLGETAPDAARLAMARALFARALETPGGLRIQTIHGFCERLLARFPLEAGVAPGFEIADDARVKALQAAAWRRVCESGSVALAGAIDRFGARLHADAVNDLVDALATRRGSIGAFVQKAGGIEAAQEALRQRHGAPRPAADIAAAFLSRMDWALLQAVSALLAQSGSRDVDAATRLRPALESHTWAALEDALLKSDGEPYKSPGAAALRKKHASELSAFNDLVADFVQTRALFLSAERAADASALLTLADALARGYADAKDLAGALDFEDLIARAGALVHDSSAAPWVLYKLDGGLTHILIDEGQDTSPAQWRLIEPLQAEFFAGEGAQDSARTVFAVGDPKQSIYAFQGADPEQFLGESQRLAERAAAANRPFAAPTLAMSFRSTPEVLRAVDETFYQVPLSDGPLSGDVAVHTAHRERETGRVEHWPLAEKSASAESIPWDAPHDTESKSSAAAVLCAGIASAVKSWIAEGDGVWEKGRLRPMRAGDVLVLVRSRGPIFTQVLRALKRAGLPVAGADRVRLAEEIAVQDILAAARVALDGSDDLSLATLLKSPFIGLTDDDEDIFPLAHARAADETLLARLMATQDAKYAPAKALIEEVRAAASMTPFAFVSMLLERRDARGASGWERLFERLGQEARDPVEEVLSRAQAIGRSGPASLQHFLASVERDDAEVKREAEQGVDAVQIMTVHGAKGLERPVVILADTTGPPSDAPSGGVQIDADGVSFRVKRSEDDSVTCAVRTDLEAAALREHHRLLYVAMTRARDRLIVCGAARGNLKGGAAELSWWKRVEDGMARAGATRCETPFGDGVALGERLLATQSREEIIAAAGPAPAWLRERALEEGLGGGALAPSRLGGAVLSPRGSALRRFARGRRIHGLLQRLPDVAPQRRTEVAQIWLKAHGADAGDIAAEIREAMAVLDDPAFAAVFGAGSRAEAPIVAVAPDGRAIRGAIDRMVVSADAVLFVDFKTDRPPPATPQETAPRILAQMAAYRAALAQIFPGRAVRAAIIWTDGPRLMPLPDALLDATAPEEAPY